MGRPKLEDKQDTNFAFRISSEEKVALETQIEKKRNAFNNKRESNRNKITKNDIIKEAINIGLKKISLKDLPYREKKRQEK